MKPTIDIHKPADDEIIGEGAERIRETRQGLYDLFPIGPGDLDYEETSNWWPAGSLTGGMNPAVDNDNPPNNDQFQDRAFLIGQKTLRWDYNIPADHNAITPGPIDTGGVSVDVPVGSTWTVVGAEDLDVHYLRDLEDVNVNNSNDGDALIYDHSTNSWYASPAPKGPQGPEGPDGPPGGIGPEGPVGPEGPEGGVGPGIEFKGEVPNKESLPGWPNSYSGEDGDAFLVGDTQHLWIWGGGVWSDMGNVVGPQGPAGPQGDQGIPGPGGSKGDPGDKGDTATISVGPTTTGAPGTNASVVNVGTTNDGIFNFTIPRGDPGDDTGDTTYYIEARAAPSPELSLIDNEGNMSSVTFDGTDNIYSNINGSGRITYHADLENIPGPVNINATDSSSPNFIVNSSGGAMQFQIYGSGVVEGNYNRITHIGDPIEDSDVATKQYVDQGEEVGVQLDNPLSWERGQYNTCHRPTSQGTGFATRYNFNSEIYPVIELNNSIEPAYIADPENPTTDGLFMSITWISHNTNQIWTLDQTAFGPGVIAPEDHGVNQNRIYYSRSDGLWHEVG